MKLSRELSERAFELSTEDECRDWLLEIDRAIGGLSWTPVGGIEDPVHAVEVSSDPAAAIVERVTNAIDAVLDLAAMERGETAPSPYEAAHRWFGVPKGGLSEIAEHRDRQRLADMIQVSNKESGDGGRPTIVIRESGCGQHPDDFPTTLLSLMKSNKKSNST